MNLPTVPPFDSRTARTWATIRLDTLIGNVRKLTSFVGPTGEVVAVLKADGYGHGAIPIARTCAAAGIRHFAVAAVSEAAALRHAGIAADIYLLSPCLPEEMETVARLDIIPFISSADQLAALRDAARSAPFPARFFLMVDTGMGREGCPPDEAAEIAEVLQSGSSNIRLTGIATHLSSADEADGDEPTRAQIAAFEGFLAKIDAGALAEAGDGRGNRGLWLSLCNSPGTIRFPLPPVPRWARGYLFRAGLLLYGIEPYRGAFATMPSSPHAILSWRARVTLVKTLPAGSTVGYGRTHTLRRPSRIATLAVGYADGLSRRLSNRGEILLAGKRFPIVGRVSMDQCQIDVTDADMPIMVGMTATLIGTDAQATQTVLDLAEIIETTPHELTCDLSARVRRLYEHAVPSEGPGSLPSPDNRP